MGFDKFRMNKFVLRWNNNVIYGNRNLMKRLDQIEYKVKY